VRQLLRLEVCSRLKLVGMMKLVGIKIDLQSDACRRARWSGALPKMVRYGCNNFMSRRQFLVDLLTLALISSSSVPFAQNARSVTSSNCAPRWLTAIARRYCDLRSDRRPIPLSEHYRLALLKKINEDFEHHRTIIIDGWVFAEGYAAQPYL